MSSLNEETLKREASMELVRREMQRKSLDTIRIYNPLDRPFRYMYDGFWHQVPAKGTKDEPRYLAMHFFKKISNELIGQQMIAKGEELLKLREKQLGKSFIDKYEENREIWDRTPRMDDPELLKKIAEIVIVGVVEEYGMELPEETAQPTKPVDLRSIHDQIFSSVDIKRVPQEEPTPVIQPSTPPTESPKYPINKKKLAQEVTNQ